MDEESGSNKVTAIFNRQRKSSDSKNKWSDSANQITKETILQQVDEEHLSVSEFGSVQFKNGLPLMINDLLSYLTGKRQSKGNQI